MERMGYLEIWQRVNSRSSKSSPYNSYSRREESKQREENKSEESLETMKSIKQEEKPKALISNKLIPSVKVRAPFEETELKGKWDGILRLRNQSEWEE